MAEPERPGNATAPPVIAPPIQRPPIPPIRAKKSNATIVLIVALVLGVGFFVVVIGAAILIPGLLRARMTANETSAMTSLRAIAKAQVVYSSTCGNGGFAESLTTLGRPAKDGEEAFLDQSLTGTNTPQISGYSLTMVAGAGATTAAADCHGTTTVTAFYAAAVPITYNTTGTRSFAVNSTNALWMLNGAAAPLEPFGAPATIVR